MTLFLILVLDTLPRSLLEQTSNLILKNPVKMFSFSFTGICVSHNCLCKGTLRYPDHKTIQTGVDGTSILIIVMSHCRCRTSSRSTHMLTPRSHGLSNHLPTQGDEVGETGMSRYPFLTPRNNRSPGVGREKVLGRKSHRVPCSHHLFIVPYL